MPRLLRLLLLVAVIAVGARDLRAQQGLRPERLAIFYGWPTLVNGSGGDVEAAAATFEAYHQVVFGAGLEQGTHPDHAGTARLVERLTAAGVEVFGYVPLGVSTLNLSRREIRRRIRRWAALGVTGVFLDEAGYDYGVSRERQNDAVAYAHRFGLVAFVNAWEPDDVFGRDRDPLYNPSGRAPRLRAGDLYLHESFQVQGGLYRDPEAWRRKTERALAYREAYGVRLAAITTPAPGAPVEAYDADAFSYAWHSALLYGLDSVGWGEDDFSAVHSRLPFRLRPAAAPGSAYLDDVRFTDGVASRRTDAGRVEVDLVARTAAFVAAPAMAAARTATSAEAPAAVPDAVPDAAGLALDAYPNPFADRAHLALTLDASQPVRVEVFDLLGRSVALLHDGPLPAGVPHAFTLEAADLAPGRYLVRVRGAGVQATRMVTRVR